MKIFLIAFRGAGGFDTPKYQNEPALIKAGHVGIQFEDDERIFGFHPTPEAAGGEDAVVELLLKHIPQPGSVQDDTAIFERAYELWQQGERTEVLMLTYEVSEEEFQEIRTKLMGWYNNQEKFRYNFPNRAGQFTEGEYNCATFPGLLGLALPVNDGRLAYYMEKMREKGAVLWQKDT